MVELVMMCILYGQRSHKNKKNMIYGVKNLQNCALSHVGNIVVVKAHRFWWSGKYCRVQNVDIRKGCRS